MLTELQSLQARALAAIEQCDDARTLRDLEVQYLGKKGEVTQLLRGLGKLDPTQRGAVGQASNDLRQVLRAALDRRIDGLERERLERLCRDPHFDATLPVLPPRVGSLHPLTQVTEHLEDVFRAMGFRLLDYPEAESEFYNFEALNIPATHPARDMQDTFWLNDGHLMRTHTSAGQVRAMREFGAPLRAIFAGKVFRYEATDASHEHTFHQVEGLMVDRQVSVANLIYSMRTLLQAVFEREVEVRLRPGYFPFVEPGFELDVQCQVCAGKGCPVCKYSSWVELMPCGLVHPQVLRFGGLDPEEWSGWAFGLGLSRMVMMKYQIDDVRRLLSGDLRFNRQFVRG